MKRNSLLSALFDMAVPIKKHSWFPDIEAAYIAKGIQRDPWCHACLTCEEVFADEDATRVIEPHGERTLACPFCGSGEIE